MLAGPWSAEQLSPHVRRALPSVSRIHTCNLLARTVTRLPFGAGGPGAASVPASPPGEFVAEFPLCLSSLFFLFLLKLLFNSAKGSILRLLLLFFFPLNLNFLIYTF